MISRGPAPGPSPASRALARAAARRVLIVDDAQAFRSRLRRLLEQLGYWRIYEAANGRDAIAAVQASRFDLVLLDVALGDVDGISVLGVIRRLDRRARVVVVTAAATAAVVRQAKAAGAAKVYVKPIDDEAFKAELSALVERDERRF